MLTPRHYAKAPITEAIIDLRIEHSANNGVADLDRFIDEIAIDYPHPRPLKEATGQFKFGNTLGASIDSKHVGFIISGADGKNIVQVRNGGLSFSRLAPYERWEPFRDEARRLWNTYCGIVAPAAVTRIAVRYVNRLDLPLPVRDFSDYLRVHPEVSEALPQGLAGFFLRLEIPQVDIGAMLFLNETVVPPPRGDVVSVVLDIDVFRTQNVPDTEPGRWAFFEILRNKKNEVFEASITDLTRELIR